jgi:hypothetical protein
MTLRLIRGVDHRSSSHQPEMIVPEEFKPEKLLMLIEEVLYFSKADEEQIVLDFIYTRDLNECEVREDEDGDPETVEVLFRTKEHCRNCGRRCVCVCVCVFSCRAFYVALVV